MTGARAGVRLALLGVCLVWSLGACATGSRVSAGVGARPATPPPATARLSGRLTVFAAASLDDAFDVLAEQFEDLHPDVSVVVSHAGSSTLAAQIVQGAPADLFASADQRQVDVVADAGLLRGRPIVMATNRLEIAVEPGNPRGVDGLEDLGRPGLTVVLAADEVPAGAYARRVLDAAGVTVRPASLEPDVRAVLSRVALGEADAGLVYTSDVVAAGDDVEGVEIPAADNVVATYPVGVLAGSPNPAAARSFLDFLQRPASRRVLTDLGFSAP